MPGAPPSAAPGAPPGAPPAARAYYVYWIVSDTRASYIGATVDPARRLRQHNGLLVGGAARTRGRRWGFECVVSGFRTWREALMFEWAAKFCSKRCRGVASRREALERLMGRERWTSNSPPARDVPLVVEWRPERYGARPVASESAASPARDAAGGAATRRPAGRARRRPKGFTKSLHGVSY